MTRITKLALKVNSCISESPWQILHECDYFNKKIVTLLSNYEPKEKNVVILCEKIFVMFELYKFVK